MKTVSLARHAMATRFEIVLHGEDPVALRAAGEEALDEIARMEKLMSFYDPSSALSRLNARAGDGPVRVEPELFVVLEKAAQLSAQTGGAFDPTVGPLVRLWTTANQRGFAPTDAELIEVRKRVGMKHVILNEDDYSVRFEREGMLIDLGSIGKGYALDVVAELLRDLEIDSALIHGGTSSACAIGAPPGEDAWRIAIAKPEILGSKDKSAESNSDKPLEVISLKDESLSVSALSGKAFEIDDHVFGHVMDARTGRPANGAALAAVALQSGTESDALATALLLTGRGGMKALTKVNDAARVLIAEEEFGECSVVARHLL